MGWFGCLPAIPHEPRHGRNHERGMALVEEIEREGSGSARFYSADFASFAQIRELGEAILRDYERLDVLVNNAGVGRIPEERLLSEDGHEFRFQVNYLAGFLLTRMLMPRLLSSTPSRIVNVSSLSANPIDFDERINLGLEYRFAQPGASMSFALRGGYKTNHDTEDYSFGGGIRFKNETGKGFRIDYAFRHFNGDFFDSVNIISGGITF